MEPQTIKRRWTKVATKAELLAWVEEYPRGLILDIETAGEPPVVMWHDMALSSNNQATWATCVASYKVAGYGPEGNYQHISCIPLS
jgi:hypothetical protein